MVPWIVLFSLLFFPCACSEHSTVQFFYHVVDSMWSFSWSFSSFVPLTPLLATKLCFLPLFTLIVLLPSWGMSLEPPPNCLVSLSYLTPQCWAFLLFNHSPPLITSSSCPLNVQKRIKKWLWPTRCIRRGRRERRAKKGLRARKENRVPPD